MNLSNHSYFLATFAGLAFFMYGLEFVSASLKKLMGDQVRGLLAKLSNSKPLAIAVGILLTMLLQSSGAVTSLLVGLGKARVITLPQVMGVIIGTAIGTTLTVQLISFNIAQIGLPVFSLSFFAYFLAKKETHKNLIGICMGFGLVFFGLELMSTGANHMKEIEFFQEIFAYLSKNQFTALLLAAVFTGVVHSSAVTIGLAMALVSSNSISMYDCLFWIYGANLGTTSTALVAAVGGNAIGRQVAWANVLFKLGGVIVFYFIPDYLMMAVEWIGGDISRQAANAHTLFNFISALLFYPFIGKGAEVLQKKILPRPQEREFGPKFLDRNSIMTPVIAFSEASREVSRMGDIVLSMIHDSIQVFDSEDIELVRSLHDRDNKVDLLQREIKNFLISVGGQNELTQRVVRMVSYVSDLENAADIVDRGLLELARKKNALKLTFSKEGWDELKGIHKEVIDLAKSSVSCFQMQDKGLAQMVIDKKRRISKMESELRTSHFERLNKGMQQSLRTSSIHIDLLADYKRIASVLCNHAYEVLKNDSDGKL
ncbi:MAG: Na/Pi cotransporter family protein [Bdellovibrionales bacterium]|nr:Na/Pi cotransporter family protein [Bdellovibrionales bacterium]